MDLVHQIIVVLLDSTSDNTGIVNGGCKHIEEYVGKAILRLECRRYVFELHMQHVATFEAD